MATPATTPEDSNAVDGGVDESGEDGGDDELEASNNDAVDVRPRLSLSLPFCRDSSTLTILY